MLVQAYADMLRAQLRGERVVKSDRIRGLGALLPARSPASIERKMQNVSAILEEQGLARIDGYAGLSHYQGALAGAVLDIFGSGTRTAEALERYASNAVAAPSIERLSTDDVLVDRPSVRRRGQGRATVTLTTGPSGALRDFKNAELGRAGEEWVLELERERLDRADRRDLADRVAWVARDKGDGYGFDIGSFRPTGEELKVEVKTTNLGPRTPFYITRWEVQVSEDSAADYALYRVFDFHRDPRLFILPGSVKENAILEPKVFLGYPS